MRIVIPDDYQNCIRTLKAFALLDGHDVTIFHDAVTDIDILAERFKDAEAIVLTRERTAITAELLERLPKLKVISQTGKVSRHIDVAACKARGITVLEGSGNPISTAELTWALIMASRRHLVEEANSIKAGGWQRHLGRRLHGQRMGVWAYGKIGSLIAGYGKAFGMQVWVWGREGSTSAARAAGYDVAPSLEALFAESDVVSMHLRLVPETTGIVQRAHLDRMKPDALFVNTSRAELVEKGALLLALNVGRPGFAALDVFEQEPVPPGDPLIAHPNVLASPHLGYVERGNYEGYFGEAFGNLVGFAKAGCN